MVSLCSVAVCCLLCVCVCALWFPVVCVRGENLCQVLGSLIYLVFVLVDVSLRDNFLDMVCLGQCRAELWGLDCMLPGKV